MYHVNKETGRANICRAKTPEACPLRTELHDETKEGARQKFEDKNKHKNLDSLTKNPYANKDPKEIDNDLNKLLIQHTRTITTLDSCDKSLQKDYVKRIPTKVERLTELKDKTEKELTKIVRKMDDIDKEFMSRGKWNRYFYVPDGHIHRSMDCSTCNNGNKRTQFALVANLSGETDADAVEEKGAILCTVCYPDAPVDWTNKYDLEKQAKEEQKCPGSGRHYDKELPRRTGYYTGNWAQCPECGEKITVSKSGTLRSHKKK